MSDQLTGPRVARWWARRYTHSLPAAAARQRVEQIESDLFDHQHDASTADVPRARFNRDVAGRVLRGVPADLAWRRSVQHARVDRPGFGMRVSKRSADLVLPLAALACAPASMLLPFAVISHPTGAFELAWTAGSVILSALLILGLVFRVRGQAPGWSTTLLVIGAPAPSLAFFWLPPVYLLSAAVVVAALASLSAARSAGAIPAPQR